MRIGRETAKEVLEAIDLVCSWCDSTPEDIYGIDPCAECKVIEIADRMWSSIDDKEEA